MELFEYDITRHSYEAFKELVYYCTESGECGLDDVPETQTKAVKKILNEKGRDGWELVQMIFGTTGFMAFWKKRLGSAGN